MQASKETQSTAGRAVLTVAMCCLLTMTEGLDLQAPGLTLPVLGPLFKISTTEKILFLPVSGWFLSISTFGLMIGAAIGGRLSDLIGRKWVLIVSAALFGLFSLCTALSGSVHMLMTMRFLTGLGLGGALPNLIALSAESVSAARRHTAIGFLYGSMPAGGGVASLIVAFASAPSQWPVVYLAGGVAPLVIVPLLMFILPNHKPAQRQAQTTTDGVFRALFGEGRALRTVLLWIGFFCGLLIMYLLLGWLPSLMRGRGLTPPQASIVQVAFNGFGALGSILTGLLLDRGRRAISTAVVFAATAAALAYLAGAPSAFVFAVLAGGLAGATVSGVQATLYALAPSCYPTRIRGTGVGFAVAVGRLGSAAGPILGGLLIGAGHSAQQVLMTLVPIIAVSAVGAILVAVMARESGEAAAVQA
jgi:AAHS family 3-hydroxyphenylpropionic acid transporter